jgi:hypothetical protein
MKKLILQLLFVFLCFKLSAQVPQSICYQAVATDPKGVELIAQPIKVRLSILKTNVTGAVQYIETHDVITDGFGLFNLNIGKGTSQSGGAFTDFSNINWGKDIYFLKVEMDIANGSNFLPMGTSQLLSVPYALYSDKSKNATTADTSNYAIKAASSLTALDDNDRDPNNELQDLTFTTGKMKLTAKSGASSEVNLADYLYMAPGYSMEYPLGSRGEVVNIPAAYTVPTGKYLFIAASKSDIALATGEIARPEPSMPVFNEGTNITSCQCFGILVDKKSYVDIINRGFTSPGDTYTVPAGKTLVIKSGLLTQNGPLATIGINGDIFELYNGKGLGMVVIKEGKTLNFPNIFLPSQKLFLTGYLISNN